MRYCNKKSHANLLRVLIVSLLLSGFSSFTHAEQDFVAVCDRSPAILTAIQVSWPLSCSSITEGHVNQMTQLIVNSAISSIADGDLSGMEKVENMYFQSNSISSFPSGSWEGLDKLKFVYFSPSISDFYTLETATFSRSDGTDSSDGPATITVSIPYSFPFDIYFNIAAVNGVTSTPSAFIAKGQTVSDSFTLTQTDSSIKTELRAAPHTVLGWSGQIKVGTKNYFSGSAVDTTPSACNRSDAVVEAMLNALKDADKTSCGDISATDIAGIYELLLQGKELTTLKPYDFAGMDNLVSLDLSDNSFTTIPEGIFLDLDELTWLDLSYNSLSSVLNSDFAGLTSLESISLHHNDITAIGFTAIKSLENLDFLDLSHNKLTSLSLDWPDRFGVNFSPYLSELVLSHNQLVSVSSSNLNYLDYLRYLHLDNNKLTSISNIGGMDYLEYIDLSHNNIPNIAAGFIDGSSDLEVIDLSNNSLTTLPEFLFDTTNQANLERLDLRNNQITALPSDLLTYLDSLHYLWVQNNALTSLPDDFFVNSNALNGFNSKGNGDILSLDLEIENSNAFADENGAISFKVKFPAGFPLDQTITLSSDDGTFKSGSKAISSVEMSQGDTITSSLTFTFDEDANDGAMIKASVDSDLPSTSCSFNLCYDGFEFAQANLSVFQAVAFDNSSLTIQGKTNLPLEEILPELSGSPSGASYSFASDLPEGLSFDSTNRSLSGSPTTVGDSIVIYQGDLDGVTANLSVNISIVANALPTFSETVSNQSFYLDDTIDLDLPEAAAGDGDTIYSFIAVPQLPEGITFDSDNHKLSGSSATEYTGNLTLTATDEDGDFVKLSFQLEVTINTTPYFAAGVVPTKVRLIVGETLESVVFPVASSGVEPITYSMSGLPSDVTFNDVSRTLSQPPSSVFNATIQYIGTDSESQIVTADILLDIEADVFPTFSSDNPETIEIARYEMMTPVQLSNSTSLNGGFTYQLDNLPEGLEFNATTLILSGLPIESFDGSIIYSVTDIDGDQTNQTITLTVNSPLELGAYNPDILTIYEGDNVSIVLPAANGGSTPYTYTLTGLDSQALDGLGFNSSNQTIYGIAGSLDSLADIVYTVTDSDGTAITLFLTIKVVADESPTFNQSNPSSVSLNINDLITPIQLAGSDLGNGVLEYSISELPTGLSFDDLNLIISGTPTEDFNSVVTYTITDEDGDSISANISFQVSSILTLANTDVTQWTFIQGENVQIELPNSSGGVPPLVYSLEGITDTILSGISFISSSRKISGTAGSSFGTVNLVYNVTDSINDTVALNISITIEADELPRFNQSNPDSINVKINEILTPVQLSDSDLGNGELVYTVTNLPSGISFDTDSLMLTGTPSQLFDDVINYSITDANNDTVSALINFSVTSLPTLGELSSDYWILIQESSVSIQLPSASGGADPLNYTLTNIDDAVLAGITFDASTQTISGTTGTVDGVVDLVYTVTDADSYSDSVNLSIVVETQSIPDFKEDFVESLSNQNSLSSENFSLVIEVDENSGNGDITIEVTGLPQGLSFNSETNEITGNSEQVGEFSVEIKISDQDNNEDSSDEVIQSFTLNILDEISWDALLSESYEFALFTEIDNITLPLATGGSGNFTYDLIVVEGSLPAGLTYNSTNGTISGSATEIRRVVYDYIAEDSNGNNITVQFEIIAHIPTPQLPATFSIPSIDIGNFTSIQLPAASADALYTYTYELTSTSSNALPVGMEFDAATRTFSGTPTTSGEHTLLYTATNAEDESDSISIKVVIRSSLFERTQEDIIWRQALIIADQIASSAKRRASIMKDGQVPFEKTDERETVYLSGKSDDGVKYGMAAWSEIKFTDISRQADNIEDWKGSTSTTSIGIEGFYDRVLVGISSSTSVADIALDNSEYTIDIASINPYVAITFDQGYAWAVSGSGDGTAESDYQSQAFSSDAKFSVIGAGFDFTFFDQKNIKASGSVETIQSKLSISESDVSSAVEGKASRTRAKVQVEREFELDNGAFIAPSLALAYRSDSQSSPGNSTETGLETSFGLAFSYNLFKGAIGFTAASISVKDETVDESSIQINFEVSSPTKLGPKAIFFGDLGSRQLDSNDILNSQLLSNNQHQLGQNNGAFEQLLGYTWQVGNGRLELFTSWQWDSEQWNWQPNYSQSTPSSVGFGFNTYKDWANIKMSFDTESDTTRLTGRIRFP